MWDLDVYGLLGSSHGEPFQAMGSPRLRLTDLGPWLLSTSQVPRFSIYIYIYLHFIYICIYFAYTTAADRNPA